MLFSTAATISFALPSLSSPSALIHAKSSELTFENQVSTKNAILARVRAEVGLERLAGKNDSEGKESAKNWATIPDSVIISSERRPLENLIEGTRPRW